MSQASPAAVPRRPAPTAPEPPSAKQLVHVPAAPCPGFVTQRWSGGPARDRT
jgi:proline-rich tail region repeat protein